VTNNHNNASMNWFSSPSHPAVRDVLIILAVYVLAFGPYALVDAPFWDDWVIMQHSLDGLWEFFSQAGRREHYFALAPFVAAGVPALWTFASTLLWAFVPVCVYFILREIGWARSNALWAGALTAAAPLNQARFALAVLPYSFSAALFAGALLLLAVATRKRKYWPRVLAAGLLLLSFPTNSFLTISWLAPLVVFLVALNSDPGRDAVAAMRRTLMHAELFLLPFLYWIWKVTFQKPYGLYKNYNQFRHNIADGFVETIQSFPKQIPDPKVFFPTANDFLEAFCFAVALCLGLWLLARVARIPLKTRGTSRSEILIALCVVAVAAVCALFPYIMVGHRPAYLGLWASRHQTTLALIAGIASFLLIHATMNARFVPVACGVLLGAFLAFDVAASRQLLADSFETKAIVHSPEIAKIPPGAMVALIENDSEYRMFGRYRRFYEVSSMLNAMSAKKDKCGASAERVIDPKTRKRSLPGSKEMKALILAQCTKYAELPQYGFGDFQSNGGFAEVTLRPKSPPAGFLGGIRRAVWSFIAPDSAVSEAVGSFDIQVRSYKM
jgi:hypothetical protein